MSGGGGASWSNVVMAILIVFALLLLAACAVVEIVEGYRLRKRPANRPFDIERAYAAPAFERPDFWRDAA